MHTILTTVRSDTVAEPVSEIDPTIARLSYLDSQILLGLFGPICSTCYLSTRWSSFGESG